MIKIITVFVTIVFFAVMFFGGVILATHPQWFKESLEVGQVWCRPVSEDPFNTDKPKCKIVLAIKDGWVQYRETDVGVESMFYHIKSSILIKYFVWDRELQ